MTRNHPFSYYLIALRKEIYFEEVIYDEELVKSSEIIAMNKAVKS